MSENKNDITKYKINGVKRTIKSKFPELNDITLNLLTDEAIAVYKEYYSQNNDIKIIISRFLIFYICQKLENNLSNQDLIPILKDNEDAFSTASRIQVKTISRKDRKEIKQNKEDLYSIKEKLSSHIIIDDCLFKRNITTLSRKYSELPFKNIAVLIINAIDEKIIRDYKEYNLIEYCKNFEIDFYKVIDTYIGFCILNPEINKSILLVNAIDKTIINSSSEKIYRADLSRNLEVNKHTFENKFYKLKGNFHFVPKHIILNGICDYYYIKKHDNKLLNLKSKIFSKETSSSFRDCLLLEIVLLRMEQVLTYEEAYEIAIKNFENGTSLLYLKYGDSDEDKKQDIHSKKIIN